MALNVLLMLSLAVGAASSKRPLVIAHRGASGVLPEHTVEAYKRAITDGADVIECDVTLSQDLVPVCLHEELLHVTTDVAYRPEFVNRTRTITVPVDGNLVTVTGWFAFDFTVSELKTLRKRQPLEFRDHTFDGQFTIPTLAEHIDVAKSASRQIAIYPEPKNPALINLLLSTSSQHFEAIRFEDIVLGVLENKGYRNADDPCYIQCYDEQSLLYFKNRTRLPLVMLTRQSVSNDRLADWSQSFYGVGVWHNVLAPHWTEDNGFKNWIGNNITDFVARAHAHGLKVHVFTLRNEDRYLAWDFVQDVHNAYDFHLSQDVDGIFTDFPHSLSRYLDLVYNTAPRATDTVHWTSVAVATLSLVAFRY